MRTHPDIGLMVGDLLQLARVSGCLVLWSEMPKILYILYMFTWIILGFNRVKKIFKVDQYPDIYS